MRYYINMAPTQYTKITKSLLAIAELATYDQDGEPDHQVLYDKLDDVRSFALEAMKDLKAA